jgi:hypothetical protein
VASQGVFMSDVNAQVHIYEEWHRAITAHDLKGVMALYAKDAVLETTILVMVMLPIGIVISRIVPPVGVRMKDPFV